MRPVLLVAPSLAAMALAACTQAPEVPENQVVPMAVNSAQAVAASDDRSIPCAHEGAELQRDCLLYQDDSDAGRVLTVRHPDGAFRRLLITTDGRGVIAADGAVPAVVKILDAERIEVSIAGDRYQLPATVRAPGTAAR